MKSFLKFKGEWRSYQKRILDELTFHLADNKIHVVAAPGAGKTTLGIEIISRLNKPAIILAPTITIKNQWKLRIENAFLDSDAKDIISTDIRNPKFITIITYQALLAAFSGKEDDEKIISEEDDEKEEKSVKRFSSNKADDIIKNLKSAKIEVLCFDEAHHLRNEWWKALDYLVEELQPEQTLSMTATPPYDVDLNEWQRYEELCGEIDQIISIPELVKNNDLCPHQDFIHFSKMRKAETEQMHEQVKKLTLFVKNLMNDTNLLDKLENLREIQMPEFSIEIILDNPELFISIASLLKTCNRCIPKTFLDIFDAKISDIPAFTSKYCKIFLNGLLIKNSEIFPTLKDDIENLKKEAKKAGIIEGNSVYLSDSPKFKRKIANSIGKLDSIVEIVALEVSCLKEKLRMVILADYIKYDDLQNISLGVMPIWDTLRRKYSNEISLGVLSGKVILIPKKIEEDFYKKLEENDLDINSVSISVFDRDDNFLKITPKESTKTNIVNIVTQMFNNGSITVLIGTQALLGEGWDAPSINSLILSSTVSSYMLSNQMRGRAIRKDKNNPDKVSNIWHLASIKIKTDLEDFLENLPSISKSEDELNYDENYDIAQLTARFEGYEAPSLEAPYVIESGILRILPKLFKNNPFKRSERDFIEINSFMIHYAKNREYTRKLWQTCLINPYNTPEKTLTSGVETQFKMNGFLYSGGLMTFVYSFMQLLVIACIYFIYKLPMLALGALCAFVICMAPSFIRFVKCGSPDGVIKQIGIVTLETLYAMGHVKTSLNKIRVVSEKSVEGKVYFAVKNVSPEENNLIIKSMREFLDPIENPRYIFIRDSFLGFIKQKDYHSVPSIIAQNKKNIDVFTGLWRKYVGPCDIVYTRTAEGRRLLLKARKSAFSSLVRPKSRKISRWQ